MKAYVVIWLGVNTFYAAHSVMTFILLPLMRDVVQGRTSMTERDIRLSIAVRSVYIIFYILQTALDVLVLVAYYRLGN